MQVNIFEAKNRLSELIKAARAGEDVIIANRGEPVARLVAADAPAPMAGNGKEILRWHRANPLPDYAKRSAEEIDAAIEEERAAWD